MLALIAALVLANAQPAGPSAPAQAAPAVRRARPIALTFSPDLYVLHAQQYADMLVAPVGLRVAVNLTSRVALTSSVGSLPNLLRVYDIGARAYLFESSLTPYGGVDLGYLRLMSGDSPDETGWSALAIVGFSLATRGGFDLAAEAAAGWQGESLRNSVLLRFGLRLGYRFGF